jgi:Predicted hydrolase (metallo-beta-lactamase superfamily)
MAEKKSAAKKPAAKKKKTQSKTAVKPLDRRKLHKALLYVLAAIVIAVAGYFAREYLMPAPLVDGTVDFHFIDVGQGDGALIMTEDGNVLIDAGPASSATELNAYLDKFGVTDIEYAIFSHPHEDHIGGAASVVNSRNIKNVIMPDAEYDTKTYDRLLTALEASTKTNVIPAKSGDVYELGNVKIRILAPNSDEYKSTNDYSVVAKISYGATSFMFTGDAEALSEREIMSVYNSYELKSNLLKVGHHGSTTSSSDEFLDAVNPSIAVICCATGNDYGHPHTKTMEKLTERNITVYRTDIDGSIILTTNGTDIYKK